MDSTPPTAAPPVPPGARLRPSPRTLLLLGLLAATLHLARFTSHNLVVDDAYITFRVARNLLAHGVATFDPTRPPVEGMTNLLWMFLSCAWIGAAPTADPALVARYLGFGLHLATLAGLGLLLRRVARRVGGDGDLALAACLLLCAACGNMAFYAGSGLETPLYLFLLVLAAERLSRGTRPAALVGGALLGLAAATRPEAVLLGSLACAGLALPARTRPLALPAALAFGLLVSALEVYRWVTWGALVPNTFHAKPPSWSLGLSDLASFLVFALGVVGPLAAIPALRRVPGTALVAVLVAVDVLGVTWSGGDWMPGFRRLLPAWVAIVALASLGLAVAAPPRRRRVGLALLAIAGGQVVLGVTGRDAVRYPLGPWAALGRLLADTPGVTRIAAYDIGALGWYFPGSIYDLAGLTDRHLASLPGAHGEKAWDETYFRQQRPDVCVVTARLAPDRLPDVWPPSRPLVQSVLGDGGYSLRAAVALDDETSVLLLARDGLPLSEERFGPPPPPALSEALLASTR